MKIGKNPGVYRYVMLPELYSTLDQDKAPTQELKDELADTAIQITCYDRNGEEVKRVTSADPGTVEDPEAEQGSGNGGNTSGGNTNGGSTGGNTNGGNNGGGGDGGDDLDKD